MFDLRPEITSSVSPSSANAAESGAVVDALLRFGMAQDRRHDTGARELFESAFSRDAVLDFRPAARRCGIEVPLMEGRDMITSIIMNPGNRIDTTHAVTNTRVQVDNNRASATALVEAQHLYFDVQLRYALLKNIYAITARREDHLWRMETVYIDCMWFAGDPSILTGGSVGAVSSPPDQKFGTVRGPVGGS